MSLFPISFCGSLGFYFSSYVFYLMSFFHDREDDDPFECLNALVFRVLLCVSFLLSKLSLWDQLSMMLQSKGLSYLHLGRDLVCFRGSFVHQSGLPKGFTQNLSSLYILLEIFDFELLFFSTSNVGLCFSLSLYVLATPTRWLRKQPILTIAHQWYFFCCPLPAAHGCLPNTSAPKCEIEVHKGTFC